MVFSTNSAVYYPPIWRLMGLETFVLQIRSRKGGFERFRDLPAELRIKIWRMAGAEEKQRFIPLVMSPNGKFVTPGNIFPKASPALLFVSYESREEMMRIWKLCIRGPGQSLCRINPQIDCLYVTGDRSDRIRTRDRNKLLRKLKNELNAQGVRLRDVLHLALDDHKIYCYLGNNSSDRLAYACANQVYGFPELESLTLVRSCFYSITNAQWITSMEELEDGLEDWEEMLEYYDSMLQRYHGIPDLQPSSQQLSLRSEWRKKEVRQVTINWNDERNLREKSCFSKHAKFKRATGL